MSQYFILVNPAKREYIDPFDFGESPSLGTFPRGGWIYTQGLILLTCYIDPLFARNSDTLSPPRWGPFTSSWAGDTIIAAGDEQKGVPNRYGIETSTAEDPQRSLYVMAQEEYGCISHKVLVMLCEGDFHGGEYAPEDLLPTLVREAKEKGESRLLLTLGNAVFAEKYKPLEEELNKQWGPVWVEKYNKEFADTVGRFYRLG